MKRRINYSQKAKQQRRKLLVFVVIGLIITIYFSVGATAEMENEGFTVTVLSGDTMWEICEENLPANTDLREYIYKVKKANGLKSSELYVGQQLFLPY